jgi:hypothetical protein
MMEWFLVGPNFQIHSDIFAFLDALPRGGHREILGVGWKSNKEDSQQGKE